jgi:transposase
MYNYTKKSKNRKFNSSAIERVKYNVGGIDIGSSSSFVCINLSDGTKEIREYPAFTADIHAMALWLKEHHVKSVAMESTGVYWIPVYDILEEQGINVSLVNPSHVKSVPGRKTDVQDCQWLQELHEHGLIRGSFRPDQRELALRTYVRQRTKNIDLAAMQLNLMHKALTQMNIQLNLVLSDIAGVTGLQIIEAILQGERDPLNLAKLRNSKCKKSEDEIAKSLEGNFKPDLIFTLQQAFEAYKFFHAQAGKCEQLIEMTLEKQHKYDLNEDNDQVKNKSKKNAGKSGSYKFNVIDSIEKVTGVNLQAIPGIDGNLATKILSEIGTNIGRWPTVKNFTSWLGLSPNNKISGGKILNSRTKKSHNNAAQALRMGASTLHGSRSAMGAFYRKMRAKLGAPKAITAAAHKMAKIIYHMLKKRVSFEEVGQEFYEKQYQDRFIKNLQRKAKEVGFILVPIAE